MIGVKRPFEPSSDPLHPLYNPEVVVPNDLELVATEIFKTLTDLNFLTPKEDLFKSAYHAVKTWKPIAKTTKTYQTLFAILNISLRFCPPTENYTLILNNDQLTITKPRLDILCLFSDMIESMCKGGWKEQQTKILSIREPCLNMPVFLLIANLLQNFNHTIPEDISLLEVLSAVQFLQIPHLQRHFLDQLKATAQDDTIPILTLFHIFDYLIEHFPQEKMLIDDYFDAIHHNFFTHDEITLPALNFASKQLKNLEPGLQLLFNEDFTKAINHLAPFNEESEWGKLFYLLALSYEKTPTIDENCTDYRQWVILIKCTEASASKYLERVKQLKPTHFFIEGLEGLSLMEAESFSPAEEKFLKQVRKAPHSLFWKSWLIKSQIQQEKYQEALTLCDRLLEEFPSEEVVQSHLKAELFFFKWDYEKALELAELAIKKEKKTTQSCLMNEIKVLCLIDLGRCLEALAYLDQIEKPSANLISIKIEILLILKRYDETPKLLDLLTGSHLQQFYTTWMLLLQKKLPEAEGVIVAMQPKPFKHDRYNKACLETLLYVQQGAFAKYDSLENKEPIPFRLSRYASYLYCLKTGQPELIVKDCKKWKYSDIHLLEMLACAHYTLGNMNTATQVTQNILSMVKTYSLPPQLLQLISGNPAAPLLPFN